MTDKLQILQEIANRGEMNKLRADQRIIFNELVDRGDVVVPPQHQPFHQRLKGSGEALLTFATGAPAQVVGGVEGVASLVYNLVTGNENALDKAVETINNRTMSLTRTPKTPEGQAALEMMAAPFEYFTQVTEGAGEAVLDATGSPTAATATQVGLEFLPSLWGLRNTPRNLIQRQRDIKNIKDDAGNLRIDLEGDADAVGKDVVEAAVRYTEGRTQAATELGQLQSAVRNAAEIRQKNVSNMYQTARETGDTVSVGASQMGRLKSSVDDAIKDYDLGDMSTKVTNRLKELDAFASLPQNYSVKLNSLAQWRKRINKNMSSEPSEAAVMSIMKGQLDNFLDDAFDTDMLRGSPEGVKAWKNANNAFAKYKQDFSDIKVIDNMVKLEATPESVKNWVFGASAVGGKKEAGAVVAKLNEILGKNSKAMEALRAEAVFDVLQPLLRESPNLVSFVNKYDTFIKNNPTLIKELFGDGNATDLRKFRSFAAASARNRPTLDPLDIDALAARLTVGHDIAKSAAKVSLLGRAFRALRKGISHSQQRKIMSDVLGYDPEKSLISLKGSLGMAGVQAVDQATQQPSQ